MQSIEAALVAAFARGLPGVDAHLRLAPSPRVGWDPYLFPEGLREGAALLLVYPVDDVPHVLLTVRGSQMRSQPGQVSFPGGAIDASESIEGAALREASEEVGVDPVSVRVLGRLTPLHIPVTRFRLHPIVGITNVRPQFVLGEWEVERVLEVPLDHLRHAAVEREMQVREIEGRRYDVEIPFLVFDGQKVWGATAMALAEFLALLEE